MRCVFQIFLVHLPANGTAKMKIVSQRHDPEEQEKNKNKILFTWPLLIVMFFFHYYNKLSVFGKI